jgi:DNA mismatch endonuclease (patch repair protein)
MDIFSPQKRSEIMSLIRSKNSKAERLVFSYLRKEKIYFQKHYKKATGRPDLALPRKRIAVFIDGDFWHGRYIEKVTNDKFWLDKINKNIKRDLEVNSKLKSEGWSILRVWESDINRKRTQLEKLEQIKNFLLDE